MGSAEKQPLKTWGAQNVSKNAGRAKLNLSKTHNRASFNLEALYLLHTISNAIPVPSFCVLFIKYCRILITVKQMYFFKKVQRALENLLVGTFLPPGSGLATTVPHQQKLCFFRPKYQPHFYGTVMFCHQTRLSMRLAWLQGKFTNSLA